MINQYKKRQTVILLCWFLASLLLMILLAMCKLTCPAILVLAQCFLTFGIAAIVIGIKKHVFNPVFLHFPFVGIILLFIGISNFSRGHNTGIFALLGFISMFITIGTLCIAISYNVLIGKRIRCKMPLQVTCVDMLRAGRNSSGRSYTTAYICPIYEATVNGKQMRLCTHLFTSDLESVYITGTYTIYVNPANYADCYQRVKGNLAYIFLLLFGLSITILTTWNLFDYITI